MSSLDQCVDRVYAALDRPLEKRLPAPTVAIAVLDVGDRLITELNLTPDAWLESRVNINVEADTPTYVINAADYSKARYLFTKDESDPSHRRRKIPIFDREVITDSYNAGDPDIGGLTSIKHNARAAAVYFDSTLGAYRLEFAPIPNQAASYDLFYEPATERPTDRNSVAFRFPQFDGYVADKAAMRVIRSAMWKGMNAADCRAKRDEIRGDLAPLIEEGDSLFRRFKMSMTNQSSYMRVAFGRRRW